MSTIETIEHKKDQFWHYTIVHRDKGEHGGIVHSFFCAKVNCHFTKMQDRPWHRKTETFSCGYTKLTYRQQLERTCYYCGNRVRRYRLVEERVKCSWFTVVKCDKCFNKVNQEEIE